MDSIKYSKHILLVALVCMIASFTFAQNTSGINADTTCLLPGEETMLYSEVENKPMFNNEEDLVKFRDWVYANFCLPKEYRDVSFQGTIVVELVVNRKGNVCATRIVRPIDRLLEKEALRVVNESPQWQPATHRGENVSVRILIPIRLRL